MSEQVQSESSNDGSPSGERRPRTAPRVDRPWSSLGISFLSQHRELTVILGAGIAFAFFAITVSNVGFLTINSAGTYLESAAEIGIIAGPVTLLMIAREFDLSVGSMVGAEQILIGFAVVTLHWTLYAALALAVVFAVLVGLLNGFLLARTGLPSLLITLGLMFVLLGAAEGFGVAVVGNTTIGNVEQPIQGEWIYHLFSGTLLGLPVATYWWVGITVVAAWILDATGLGNRIYATGGDPDASAKCGVPVARLKTMLFIFCSLSCIVTACCSMFVVNQANATSGQDLVFEVVTACVIGGVTLSGGFGSPVGTLFAAFLFGVVSEGFFFTNINEVWYEAFVGVMLLAAIVINKYSGDLTMRIWDRRQAPSEAR